jgi:glycine/D-amino acid oxidase-like deaminating enzyme
MERAMRVIICGGGVIGACIAYFLSERRVDVTVVERTEVAAAASGKAGGFLALDWCAGTPLNALARRSFELHATLAHEIGNDWGRRGMTAYSGLIVADSDSRRRRPSQLNWLAESVVVTSRLSTPATTAIVHPLKFTSGMMRAAQRNGATLQFGRVTGIVRDVHNMTARGVQIDGRILEADAVVIAMGPWSVLASEWMNLPAVYGQRSPSIVYNTGLDVPPHALFLECEDQGEAVSIEVFPRADGSTHVTALSEFAPLPLDPANVRPEPEAIDRLQAIAERLSPVFRPGRITARQACFRPVTHDSLPLIGKVSGSKGLYVATGHNVWGILNAPATGEALAEQIIDGAARSVDLTAFDPARLPSQDPSILRTD